MINQYGDGGMSAATEVRRAKHMFEDEDDLDLDNLDLWSRNLD